MFPSRPKADSLGRPGVAGALSRPALSVSRPRQDAGAAMPEPAIAAGNGGGAVLRPDHFAGETAPAQQQSADHLVQVRETVVAASAPVSTGMAAPAPKVAREAEAPARAQLQPHAHRVPTAPAKAEGGSLQRVPAAVLAPPTVIGDIKLLASQVYNTEANESLSAEWRPMFAVMGQTSAATLLIDAEAQRRPVVYEVLRRMGEVGVRVINRQPATSEIIKLVHQSNSINGGGERKREAAESENQRMIFTIIEDAVAAGASDVHIETRVTHADIFFRINGTRVLHKTVTHDGAKSMCTVLYQVHGDATSKEVQWSRDAVHETSIEHETAENVRVQLRFSSAPIFPSGNFHAVIRVLVMDAKTNRKLDDLGYYPAQVAAIVKMLLGSSGLVLLTGPTNSGKSTSMQALVDKIFERRGTSTKIITVEDPVEYVVPGACQIGVPRGRTAIKAENDSSVFTTFLRGTLRQDPDVVVVGEIRDADSAEVTRDLVLAGRKVLSTLHTYSGLWSFVRLRELGVPIELLTMPGFVSGIIYQRLVSKLCPHCSLTLADGKDRLPADVMSRLTRVANLESSSVRVRGDGCSDCNHTGYVGRLPVCEIVVPDAHLLKLLAEGDMLGAEAYWHKQAGVPIPGGGVTALAHALTLMNRGQVDPSDVESQIASLDKDLAEATVMHGGSSFATQPMASSPAGFMTQPLARVPRALAQRDFQDGAMDQIALQ